MKQGQVLRAKAQLEQLQTEIASVARKTGISSATKLALIAPSKELFDDSIPSVEWWDAAVLMHKRFVERFYMYEHSNVILYMQLQIMTIYLTSIKE